MSFSHTTPIARLAVIALAAALAAGCQGVRSPGSEAPVQLRIGDSLQAVQAALNTAKEPVSTPTAVGGPETQIVLSERGIWVFLGPDERANQYRFDAPFAGNIHGARIGASLEQTETALGAPVRALPNIPVGQSFLYREDDGLVVRGDFDAHGVLRTIRVLGGAISFSEPRGPTAHASSPGAPLTPIVTQHGPITSVTVPGNLAVTHALDCISIGRVDSASTPPDIYAAIPRCLDANRYAEAASLFVLAGTEASFDALRVTDKTAGQARQVLIMNTFNPLPLEQRQKFGEAVNAMLADPEALGKLCAAMRKRQPPSYYPRYMILHGIRAFTGDPNENALDPHFNPQASWDLVLRTYTRCPEGD
jgi:hypothetical protein